MSVHLVLAVLAVVAARVGFLYLAPFGRCPKCKGTGHIKPARRVKVCPRCKGLKRVQRTGSRTVSDAPAPPLGASRRSRPPWCVRNDLARMRPLCRRF